MSAAGWTQANPDPLCIQPEPPGPRGRKTNVLSFLWNYLKLFEHNSVDINMVFETISKTRPQTWPYEEAPLLTSTMLQKDNVVIAMILLNSEMEFGIDTGEPGSDSGRIDTGEPGSAAHPPWTNRTQRIKTQVFHFFRFRHICLNTKLLISIWFLKQHLQPHPKPHHTREHQCWH